MLLLSKEGATLQLWSSKNELATKQRCVAWEFACERCFVGALVNKMRGLHAQETGVLNGEGGVAEEMRKRTGTAGFYAEKRSCHLRG
jgi:hypothetical protein